MTLDLNNYFYTRNIEQARIEIKLVADYAHKYRVFRWINANRYNFVKEYNDRLVNNLYLDSYDYRCINENIAGLSNRVKSRIRWYGDSTSNIKPNLEFKLKQGKLGWKDIFSIEEIDLTKSWNNIIIQIHNSLSSETSFLFKDFPLPVLVNQYKREYYRSLDKKIRITIDSNLKTFDQRNVFTPTFVSNIKMPDMIVIEFKFSPDYQDIAANLLKDSPVRPSRCSKYVLAYKAITQIV